MPPEGLSLKMTLLPNPLPEASNGPDKVSTGTEPAGIASRNSENNKCLNKGKGHFGGLTQKGIMKRYAVLDENGVMRYEVSGNEIHPLAGLVAVYDSSAVKAIIHLAPGGSIQWVTDVLGGERKVLAG